MRSLPLLLFIFSSMLFGMSLDEVIQKALDKNPSLEIIEHKISANKSNVNVSNQFENPVITLTDNTLPSDQAMSRTTLSLGQKLPYFGKRDSLERVAKAEDAVLNKNLEQARVELVRNIKNEAYTIWELEAIYQTINTYENLTRQNIDLFESYTATAKNQHMGIMSAELTLSDLRIQKATLEAQIQTVYAKLSYLADLEISHLDINLSVSELPAPETIVKHLENNKALQLREKEVKKSQEMTEVASLNSYPDINLLVSYAYRESFDDYWTFGVGMRLPIYGSESYVEEERRALTLVAQSTKQQTALLLTSEFKTAYTQMKSAYTIYHIVHDEALPQIEHMFELTNASIATGGDLFKYIDILVQKLMLEQKSIRAVAGYNRALAQITALSGEEK